MSNLNKLKESLRAFLNVDPEMDYTFSDLLAMDSDDVRKQCDYPTFYGLCGTEIGAELDRLEQETTK